MFDAVILGGGVAGLWLLDDLVRRGHRALVLEASALGAGQTVASQGIIHGGLKYTLSGRRDPSAQVIRDMPGRWRRSLAGVEPPDLRRTTLRSPCCHLWRTASLGSLVGMLGARANLRVRPVPLGRDDRPAVLSRCPGTVARLDEPVIDPASLLGDLAARHAGRILRIDAGAGLDFTTSRGRVEMIRLRSPDDERVVEFAVGHVVLAAGAGNAGLRDRLGLVPGTGAMQRRPLHMVLVRGDLPELYGHCVDGARTRVTITSARASGGGGTVWQVGGQVAEDGVSMDEAELFAHARGELEAVLPGVDLSGAEWASYRVDRAEAAAGGRRPEDVSILHEGNLITAWPTKLALAPRLAERVASLVGPPEGGVRNPQSGLDGWPRPAVAAPPWETVRSWSSGI